LLPDGSVSELSVSATLKARGEVLDSRELARPVDQTVEAVTRDETPQTTEDEP
jgi:NADH-quinone oxidoreductase subunit J